MHHLATYVTDDRQTTTERRNTVPIARPLVRSAKNRLSELCLLKLTMFTANMDQFEATVRRLLECLLVFRSIIANNKNTITYMLATNIHNYHALQALPGVQWQLITGECSTWKFSWMRDGVTDFGMMVMLSCMSQRSTTWATVFPWRAAIDLRHSWSRTDDGARGPACTELCKQRNKPRTGVLVDASQEAKFVCQSGTPYVCRSRYNKRGWISKICLVKI